MARKKRILIAEGKYWSYLLRRVSSESTLFGPWVSDDEVIHHEDLRDDAIFEHLVDGIEVLFTNKTIIDGKFVKRCPDSLRYIAIAAAGYDVVKPDAIPLLKDRGIEVATCRGYPIETVPAFAIGVIYSMITGSRALELHRRTNGPVEGTWTFIGEDLEPIVLGGEVIGKSLLVVGLGDRNSIGWEVATRARTMGMNVQVADLPGDFSAGRDIPGFSKIRIDEGFETADAITVHTALIPGATEDLITPDLLHSMRGVNLDSLRPAAVFANFSRGPVVQDEAAFREPVSRGVQVFSDVARSEPVVEGDPFWELEKEFPHLVSCTDHASWGGIEGRLAIARLMRLVVQSCVEGKPAKGLQLAVFPE